MHKESFSNDRVAAVLNRDFVSIKVDKEERPDVDRIYITFIQAIHGSAGHPMSVFLTPDLKPFYGGTYFPPHDSFGQPGFENLLKVLASKWREDRQRLVEGGNQVISMLRQLQTMEKVEKEFSPEIVQKAYEDYAKRYDRQNGGFRKRPKFPTAVEIDFLLRFNVFHDRPTFKRDALEGLSVNELKLKAKQYDLDCSNCADKGDYINLLSGLSQKGHHALEMVEKTLKKIAFGGIHDHVGYGFHRYSVDESWHVPHFEKMLYDQAQLLSTYTQTYAVTKNEYYLEVARDIVNYLTTCLQNPDGGFYSAEDADSYPTAESKEVKEGAFYVWTESEIKSILGADIALLWNYHYGVQDTGNVNPRDDPHHELQGKNVLIQRHTVEQTSQHFRIDPEDTRRILKDCKRQLFERREKRPHPHLDDKIITAWNGLVLSGLAAAGKYFPPTEGKRHHKLACDTAHWLRQNSYVEESGIIRRSVRLGVSKIDGFLDDYACLIQGLIDLYEVEFDEEWLEWAIKLQQKQDELFWDNENGGYFATTNDKKLVVRLKDDYDGAEPSGNSIAVSNLFRLSRIFDDESLKERAIETIKFFSERMYSYPEALICMVGAMMSFLFEPEKKLVIHAAEQKSYDELLQAIRSQFLPNLSTILAKPDGIVADRNATVQSIVESHRNQEKSKAFLCQNFTCVPVESVDDLINSLKQ
ncbi:Six-hairpin glycosidase-like protein [Paraphysoderma sedebokerense]|nr:Six-hairpin glycosidase-like protein [Paraphysoderma sedebokerense]